MRYPVSKNAAKIQISARIVPVPVDFSDDKYRGFTPALI